MKLLHALMRLRYLCEGKGKGTMKKPIIRPPFVMLWLMIATVLIIRWSLSVITPQDFDTVYAHWSPEAAAKRNYPDHLPINRTHECLPPHLRKAPPNRFYSSLDEFPELHRFRSKSYKVVVSRSPGASEIITWLWESVLGLDFATDLRKKFQLAELDVDIEFVRIPGESSRDEVTNTLSREDTTNLLIVGESRPLSHVVPPPPNELKKRLTIGGVILTDERCDHTNAVNITDATHDLAFQFITYGDCRVLDYDRVFTWPLGPSTEDFAFAGRLAPEDQTYIDVADRAYFLNLLVSYTQSKPTRRQAKMVVDRLPQCSRSSSSFLSFTSKRQQLCLTGATDMLNRLCGSLAPLLGIDLRRTGACSSFRTYRQALRQSVFTLCPAGNHPEQYRVWEAMMAGSIPILELPDVTPGRYVNPRWGNPFRCMPDEIFSMIRDLDAPVLWVRDWRELPALLDSLTTEDIRRRSKALIEWYNNLLVHLRTLLFRQIVRFMKPAPEILLSGDAAR